MPSSLVTGGAGFIGSHVADELIQMGHTVVVLDDLSGGIADNVNQDAIFEEGSILNQPLIERLFETHRFDYVFHLAAYAAEGLSHFIKAFNYRNNLIGSVNLINASVNVASVRCFVFTSSIAVYGSNQVPMTEDLAPEPEDPYGIAKVAVERELHVTNDLFGLPFIIFRPHNVYGERQNLGDRYRNVIGIFMNLAMKGDPFTIFGDGEQTRAFSHIADVAPVIGRSIEHPDAYGEVFNIGADTPYSVNDLSKGVANVMEVEHRVRYLPERFEVKHAFADHAKAKRYFGKYVQGITLEEGLDRMSQWAKEKGVQTVRPRIDLEIHRQLPSSWRDETSQADEALA